MIDSSDRDATGHAIAAMSPRRLNFTGHSRRIWTTPGGIMMRLGAGIMHLILLPEKILLSMRSGLN